MNVRTGVFALALALARAASAQDFTLTIQPGTLTLIPNQNASFVVSMTPFNGFTSQVALAVETLPFGVTAQFSPPTLTPPGTSVLELSAATNAALGSFTLNISAAGGGITNTTSSSVTVKFGLLQTCTGAIRGLVTDIVTGLPVAGATVEDVDDQTFTVADANGAYIFTNLSLVPPDNEPRLYSLMASGTDYWESASSLAYAVCDATNVVNFKILQKQTGSVSGQVVVQGGGTLAGVVVSANGPLSANATTDTHGAFQFPALELSYSNAPAGYELTAQPLGYWRSMTNTVVAANSNSLVTLILVPICSGTVQGLVILADSGLPATNAGVEVEVSGQGGGGGAAYVFTDSNGNYTATNLSLAFDNAPGNVTVASSYPGYSPGETNSVLSSCGETLTMPTLLLPPSHTVTITNNDGAVAGHVYDLQTGEPITNANVQCSSQYSATDTNGAYYLTNIFIGNGNVTNALAGVSAAASGYWGSASNLTIYANEVVTQDLRLLLIGYGAVVGTVRDSASALPIQGATVTLLGAGGNGGYASTDANGHYASAPLPLSNGNLPRVEGFSVSASGYWTAYTNTTITQGKTNVVDVNLIKVCTGATIVGNVVDALTQKPITNATIRVTGSGGPEFGLSDTNGNFVLTNITVGNDNSPIQTTVTASAPGYNQQSKTVTVFCDATIITEFGAPQTVFGGIEGYVTNVVTGLPLTNVFVGTGFGAAATTDTNGYYSVSQAPLGANGASRVWTVTAIPNGFPAQTQSVSVSSNTISRLDFGFGQPPTALIVTATGAPNPVTVGSNLLYLVTLTNTVAEAQQVVLSDALPPGVTFVSAAFTNSPGTPFSAPVYSNHAVTATAAEFGSNSAVTLEIRVTPSVAGTLTNVATVSSSTADLDPTGSNHTATVITSVTAPVVTNVPPHTALIVTATGAPNPVTVGSNLLYLVTLTNTVAEAQQVVLSDALPPGVTFVSAAFTNSPGTPFSAPVYSNNVVTAMAAEFGSNSAVTLEIRVTPSAVGLLTNVATVSSSTADLDPTGSNHTAKVITTVIGLADADLALMLTENSASIVLGSNIFYTLVVTNLGPADAPDVVLDDTLPASASYVSSTTSQGAITPNGGSVHWDFGALSSHGFATATLVAAPSSTGSITNSATVTLVPKGVAVADTNLANNTASVVAFVTAPVVTNVAPRTALLVTATGTPNPVTVGSNLLYLVRLTNTAAEAQQVQLSDALPPGVTFVSAAFTNIPEASFSAPVYSNNVVTTTAAEFGSNSAVALAIVVTPSVVGLLTNVATVSSSTPDLDPTGSNHTATIITSVTGPVVTNVPPATNVAVQVLGAITFNPQTGLYQQPVLFTNLSGVPAAAVRVAVLGLPSSVALYNAAGTNHGSPFVEYDQTLPAGGGVVFLLEYYDASRQPFVSTNFLATVVAPTTPPVPTGTILQLDSNGAFVSEGQLTIEFATIPGHTYVVQYSSNIASSQWLTAVPPIIANGNKTQWIDSGPPKTVSPPGPPGQRFYRVVQTN